MTKREQIAELRAEVAELRRQVTDLAIAVAKPPQAHSVRPTVPNVIPQPWPPSPNICQGGQPTRSMAALAPAAAEARS